MTKNRLKLGLGVLTVLATPIAVNTVASSDVHAEYRGSVFYYNNKQQTGGIAMGMIGISFKMGEN